MTLQPVAEPIFIVGAHRSGSTLLRVMLDHHPQIALSHEFEFTMHLVGENGEPPALDRFYSHLSLNASFSRSGFHIDRSLTFAELINSFLEQRQNGKALVGMTCHQNFDRLRFFWPNARYIHILRDPRDVANSVVNMGWAGNLWVAANRWVEAEQMWDVLCQKIPEQQRIEVRFEDLMAKPESELSRVCDFLKLAYDEKMLSYPDNSDYALPNTAAASRWRTKMPEKDIQLVEARVGDLCSARHYPVSDLPKISIGSVQEIWLKVYSRLLKSWRRLQKNPSLVLRLSIARRLGRTEQIEKITQQMHGIQNCQIKQTRYSN
ncbi:MAG: sulfotransferase [Cyanobacteria bacterium P01_D01_bin.56]